MRKTASEFPENEEILNVWRFWCFQNLLAGLRKKKQQQQIEDQIVFAVKNNEPNQKLTQMVVGERVQLKFFERIVSKSWKYGNTLKRS